MAEFYYAKPGPINPIALVGQKIAVWSAPNWVCFKVIFLEPYPRSRPLVFNLGAIGAGLATQNVPLTALKMSVDPPEMVQARFYPLDDFEVTIKKGGADTRFKSKNLTAQADRFTIQVDPDLHTVEFVILKDEEPNVIGTNPTGYALAQARMALFGFRFILDDLKFTATTIVEVEKVLAPITFIAAGGA